MWNNNGGDVVPQKKTGGPFLVYLMRIVSLILEDCGEGLGIKWSNILPDWPSEWLKISAHQMVVLVVVIIAIIVC